MDQIIGSESNHHYVEKGLYWRASSPYGDGHHARHLYIVIILPITYVTER